MADESVRVTSNRTCETATKTIEAVRLFNESSLRDSPNVDDDDSKSDEIEREKTASPSLEIAEECIESFIHQGLENVDNEHEQPASTLSDTYNRNHLEISKPLSIDSYKEGNFDHNPKLQENISNTEASHDSERHDFKERTSNIIMEAKNIINTCLLDAVNLDDSLSINADDDAVDNSEKELNEVKEEIDLEGNSKKRFGEKSTLDNERYDRTYSKSKMNDLVKSDIEDTERFLKKGDNVATDDDGINRNEVGSTKDGKKDKKKHKKHSKKKKKKHKKEKKAEKQKGKDSKVPEEKGAKGDDENSLEDQVFEMDTDVPSSSSKYLAIVKDSLPHQKRKIASIVTCVSSANASTLSDKGKPGFKEEPVSQKHKETSKIDKSKRRSSERSSKSNESIKDEVKSNISTLSSKGEQVAKEDSTSQRYWDTSKVDKSKRRSSERSSKSNEVKEGELHRQLSSVSTSSEAKDQVKPDNTSYHSDKSFGEKHKKSKKKSRHRSREEGSRESPQSVGRFSKSSIQSEDCKEKEDKKRSESSERDARQPSRHHSHESSRTSSQSEHQKSRISRSSSRESEEFQTSGIRQRPRRKSKERRSRKHDKRSGRKSKHRRSRSRSVDRLSKDCHESRGSSIDAQTKEDSLSRSRSVDKTSKNRYRSRSKSSDGSNNEIKEKRPRIQGRSRSRSVDKGKRRKRDSQRSRKKSQEKASRSDKDSSRSELNKEKYEFSSKNYPRSTLSSLKKHKEDTPEIETYRNDKTGDQKSPSNKTASKERSPVSEESNAPPKKRALSRSISRERSPTDQMSPSRKHASKERSPIRVESNAPPKKRALSRSISRERSPTDQKSPSRKHASKERSPIRVESNAPPKKRALSRSISRERSPTDQMSPSRKHASKEMSPIRVESNAPPRKRALSRSTSRERSPKKRSQTSVEVLSDYNTNSNEDSTSILNTVKSFATSIVEKQTSKERLVQGTNKTVDNTDSLKQGKEEAQDEDHVNRISKDGNSEKVVTEEDSEERKQFEANETSEDVQTSKNSNRPDEEEILADTCEGIKTIEDALDLERGKKLESSASLDTKPCIEKANVEPEDQHDAKGTDVYIKTVGSDQAMDTTSGSISRQDAASVMNNERLNQNSAANTNIQIPPPPPHLLTQNELANSNPPRDLTHNKGNLVCPPVVNPYVRTFPGQGTTMNSAPINQQPLNLSGPQPQYANQIALDQSHTVFTENVVPQGFALGPNQEPLKDNTSAPSPYIQHSSLLGLPTSASVIPFLGDEGPKILPEEKEKPSNIWAKTDAVDTNHAQALMSSPVDMDMSSPEEDIIEKMNEEFWENERKGSKKDDNSVRKEKRLESQYYTCTQVQDGKEDYDPEHFVSSISPKQKKKKDKTKKHSDSKTKVQSLIDKLHRQARVEDEVKIVLKDYYKHREINKNEYKDILRKAVPQVANSDHSIDPERIRSLVKKYVAKIKGQRHLKPNC